MDEAQVISLMKSSTTEEEWNDNCSKVKIACDGYPTFWYSTIVSSGIAATVAKNFK